MLNRVEYFLNIIYYVAFKIDYKLHLLFNKINPFLLLFKIPIQQKQFEKAGIKDSMAAFNKSFGNYRWGISTWRASGVIVLFIGLPCVIITAYFGNYLKRNYDYILFPLIPICIMAFLTIAIPHYCIHKKDKYLKYFKRFDKQPKRWKWKWAWISFGILMFELLNFVAMFWTLK